MPLKDDYGILRILRSTKAAYDKLRGRKRLTVEEKMPLVEEMTSSTLDLAPKDWKKFINEDRSLSASWRREKIQYLEDFIGTSATRTARLKDLSFVKQMALEVEWESREKEGEGVSSHSSPSPSSSSSSNRNRDETNSILLHQGPLQPPGHLLVLSRAFFHLLLLQEHSVLALKCNII